MRNKRAAAFSSMSSGSCETTPSGRSEFLELLRLEVLVLSIPVSLPASSSSAFPIRLAQITLEWDRLTRSAGPSGSGLQSPKNWFGSRIELRSLFPNRKTGVAPQKGGKQFAPGATLGPFTA